MEAGTLVLVASVLLLLNTSQAIFKVCTLHHPSTGRLEQDNGFTLYVTCSFKDPVSVSNEYKTSVTVTVKVSSSMDGWELSLQFRQDVNVRVAAAQVNGKKQTTRQQSSSSVIIRNRLQRLQKGDSLTLKFNVYSKQRDTALFPGTFQFQLPSPGQITGMCTGTEIHSPSSQFRKLPPKSRYRMILDFNVDRGISHWTACKLTFDVSVRFLAIQHAEFVNGLLDMQFVIARRGDMDRKVVIDYEILRKKVKDDGYNNSVCRTCHWNGTTYNPKIPLPETPSPQDIYSKTETQVLPTTSPEIIAISLLVSDAGAGHTERSSYVSSSPHDDRTQRPSDKTVTEPMERLTESVSTETVPNVPNPDKSGGQSSTSHAVWIGIAAACAGALIVLLVVVSVLVVSRKKSGASGGSQPEHPRTDPLRADPNAYTSVGWNGTALNGNTPCSSQFTSQFPSTPDSSTGPLLKGDLLSNPEYEELEGLRVLLEPDCKGSAKLERCGDEFPVPDCMLLPGQRLHNLPQTSQDKDTRRRSIVESGDEATEGEKTYVVMHSSYVKKDEQDE